MRTARSHPDDSAVGGRILFSKARIRSNGTPPRIEEPPDRFEGGFPNRREVSTIWSRLGSGQLGVEES